MSSIENRKLPAEPSAPSWPRIEPRLKPQVSANAPRANSALASLTFRIKLQERLRAESRIMGVAAARVKAHFLHRRRQKHAAVLRTYHFRLMMRLDHGKGDVRGGMFLGRRGCLSNAEGRDRNSCRLRRREKR